MSVTEFSGHDNDGQPVFPERGAPLDALRLVAPEALAPVELGGQGAIRPWVNDRRNGRLPVALPEGAWSPRWALPLQGGGRSRFVLHDGDRVVLLKELGFTLATLEGKRLRDGATAGHDAFLDSPLGSLFTLDSSGAITVTSLVDGVTHGLIPQNGGAQYGRTFLSRRGWTLLTVATELPIGGDEDDPEPEESMVEALQVRDFQAVDEDGLLDGVATVASLHRTTLNLQAAMTDDRLVVATRDRLFVFDESLAITGGVMGEFDPLGFSLDEADRAYVFASGAQGHALFVTHLDGRCVRSVTMPDWLTALIAPPVVTHAHDVVLAARQAVVSLDQGAIVASASSTEGFAGVSVTLDDQLLLADGPRVLALQLHDAKASAPRVLLELDAGEAIDTPPVLTPEGLLLVASSKTLYCFEAFAGFDRTIVTRSSV